MLLFLEWRVCVSAKKISVMVVAVSFSSIDIRFFLFGPSKWQAAGVSASHSPGVAQKQLKNSIGINIGTNKCIVLIKLFKRDCFASKNFVVLIEGFVELY